MFESPAEGSISTRTLWPDVHPRALLAVSAVVEKDIGHLAHVHGNYLARYPEYKGKTTNQGKGIVAVEELEASVETLMTAIRAGLTPVVRSAP